MVLEQTTTARLLVRGGGSARWVPPVGLAV